MVDSSTTASPVPSADQNPPAPFLLFGPQRLDPVLRPELERLTEEGRTGDGPVASITAGWQEREGEVDELAEHLGREVIDLRLHARTDEVFTDDPELARGYRERQDRLQELQRLYRYRLDFVLEPARELMRRPGDAPFLDDERIAAIDAVRTLDDRHLERVSAEHRRFEDEWRPLERPAVRARREAIDAVLESASAVAVAGGHVAVLVNRMRLFGLGPRLAETPILAWSAGAMALARRIVLFHDSPPQGAGNPEILDRGLGLHDLIPLPHARHRLRLEDPVRVALFVRRFGPEICVPLDEGIALRRARSRVDGDGTRFDLWNAATTAYRLEADGEVVALHSGAAS